MNKLENIDNINIDDLYNRIVTLIENAKRNVAIAVNQEMTLLYWNIGKYITDNVLKNRKAEYGKAVIQKLSQKLIIEYGRGYSKANLFRMIKFYQYFNNFEKVSTVSRKLSWSHFVELLQVQDELKLDKFRPEYKGQVELYLKWLDKYEKAKEEKSPIAIILCATKSDMMAQLLELDNSGIHVAQYLTKYVPKEILEQKLINSIENAKIQLEQRKNIYDNNK